MKINEWIKNVIDGAGGLHAFERFELASPTIPRDEAVAGWVIRCLANPECEGSADVLASIEAQRAKREAVERERLAAWNAGEPIRA